MSSTRGAVLRLHDFSCPPCYGRQVAGSSNYELVNLSGGLLRRVNQRRESWIFGSSFDRRQVPVNVIQGKGYTLKVSNRKAPLKSVHLVRPRLQNPETFLKLLDKSAFRSVRDAKIQPMFVVEVNESDPLPSELELQLTIHKKSDFTLKHIILQQDMSTMEWCDITNMCTIGKGTCCDINIPVQKSARIWVIHLKRFICSLVPSLMALLNGHIIFHILLFYQVLQKKVKVRIIGISEELYHNLNGLRTACNIAEEQRFLKCEESGPLWLLRRERSLKAEFYKDGNCFKSSEFDIGRSTTDKHAEWHDCIFYVNDLKDNLEVKVIDNNGNVQWSIDLNEILCLKEHVNALQAVDDEEKQIPWIAARVKIQNVEKVNCKFELKPFKPGFKPSETDFIDTANSDSLKCCTPL